MNTENLCMNCMKEIGNEKQCPYCGFRADSPQMLPYLPLRTVVGGRYLVGRLLEFNGDGATYMGWDFNQNTPVCIREFLPDAISQRDADTLELKPQAGSENVFSDCYQSFLELWRKLVRMRGLTALISAFDIVEDYGTAYAISEHIEGITLRDYLLQSKNGYISWDQARSMFMPVLSTLGTLHTAGIIHRGISPSTLVIGNDNKVRITGFSIGQARTARGDITAQLFPGYAAIEQYGFEGRQGPWTDIYAFAAVLYRALIGSTPIEATSRVTNDKMMIPGKFAEQIPAYVINAIINAMQILPEDRTRTVDQLRGELSAASSMSGGYTAGIPYSKEDEAPQNKQKKGMSKENKKIAIRAGILSAVACIAIVVVVVLIAFRDDIFKDSGNEDIVPSGTVSDQQIQIPRFEGQYYSTVRATASWNATFEFTVKEEYSDTVTEGMIISQDPEPDSTQTLPANGKIKVTLVVSKGLKMAKLPNVVNSTYEDAVKALEEEGFTNISKVLRLNDGTHEAGTVYSMTPNDLEKEYRVDEKIFLQVWDEPETSSEPSSTETEASIDTAEVPDNAQEAQ